MVEHVGVHRADERDVVGARGDVREQIRDLHTALAVPSKRSRRALENCTVLLDESEADLVSQRFGKRLPVEFTKLWLRIEEVDLARCAGHENEDAALGARRGVRWVRSQRVGT